MQDRYKIKANRPCRFRITKKGTAINPAVLLLDKELYQKVEEPHETALRLLAQFGGDLAEWKMDAGGVKMWGRIELPFELPKNQERNL